VNYGYVPNEPSPDREELDSYVLGVLETLEEFKMQCITIVRRKNDNDDKLVLTPPEGITPIIRLLF
jgi:inorganic pyrophosphatase